MDIEAKVRRGGARPARRTPRRPAAPAPASGPRRRPTAQPRHRRARPGRREPAAAAQPARRRPGDLAAAMAGLDSPLGLAAGAQVQLVPSVSAGAGLGVTAGFGGRRRCVGDGHAWAPRSASAAGSGCPAERGSRRRAGCRSVAASPLVPGSVSAAACRSPGCGVAGAGEAAAGFALGGGRRRRRASFAASSQPHAAGVASLRPGRSSTCPRVSVSASARATARGRPTGAELRPRHPAAARADAVTVASVDGRRRRLGARPGQRPTSIVHDDERRRAAAGSELPCIGDATVTAAADDAAAREASGHERARRRDPHRRRACRRAGRSAAPPETTPKRDRRGRGGVADGASVAG